MNQLKHYQLHEIMRKDGPYILYRASTADNKRFIIKTVDISHEEDTQYYSELLHEFHLLKQLSAVSSHIPKVVEFIESDTRVGIVSEDKGFIPLSALLAQKPIDLNTFFIIAIQIAKGLSELHEKDIIHKNINTNSIYFHAIQQALQISDFSIATQLKRSMIPSESPHFLQGNLTYIAPEQTDCTNRPLTQRADLYSMGIVFYELLIGRPPFTSQDAMTLIHDHIATIPPSPHEINTDIPEQLALIIMKLLSKSAHDRYNSALGVHSDLERAWIDFKDNATIALFELGKDDVATRLEKPDHLYGRDDEIKTLHNAFEHFYETHDSSLIIISGYSGIGKTSLVNELTERISLSKSLFARGKFDKFQQSDPYSGLRMALDYIVSHKLSSSEEEVQQFKQALLHEMGGTIDIIVEFIPQLKDFIGTHEAPPEINVTQEKNRFELALRKFIKIISHNQPLVLFLDDLQWASYVLFDLINAILNSAEINNVLFILCYRSNELSEQSPVMQFSKHLTRKIPLKSIVLSELDKETTASLLRDILYSRNKNIDSLVELTYKKTNGNPFFLLMLLEELYAEKGLYYSSQKNSWCWDEEKIAAISASDNVVEFVNHRLEKLSSDCKAALHCAACIGNHFVLGKLSLALNESPTILTKHLLPALEAGLIVPAKIQNEWFDGVNEKQILNYSYYFQHDRIQQNCYQLIPKEETELLHLNIARRWHAAYKENLTPLQIMLITEQFNKGLQYVTQQEEKSLIRELNCSSGEIAMQSIAYDMAYYYDKHAASLLPRYLGQEVYQKTFSIYYHYIKSAFLSRHFRESEQASEYTLSIARTPFDKAMILSLKGDLARTVGDKKSSLYFERGLSVLGYDQITKSPNKFNLMRYLIAFKFYLHYHKNKFEHLPDTIDKTQDLLFSMVSRLAQECYLSGDMTRWIYIFIVWGASTFSHHNKELRSLYYDVYCILWPHSKFSHNLYQKITPILAQSSKKDQTAAFYCVGSALHLLWHNTLQKSLDKFQESIEQSERCGDLELLSLSYIYKILIQTDQTASYILNEFLNIQNTIYDISSRNFLCCAILKNYYGCFSQEHYSDTNYDEPMISTVFKEKNYALGEQILNIMKSIYCIHFEKNESLETTMTYLLKNLNIINQGNSTLIVLPTHVYLSLMLCDAYSGANLIQKIQYRLYLYRIYRRLSHWAKSCPENFYHCVLLLQAESAKLKGHIDTALEYYNKAAIFSEKNNALEYAALSYHRALMLCGSHQETEKEKHYFNKTIKAYEKWQALGVIATLKEKYAHLI